VSGGQVAGGVGAYHPEVAVTAHYLMQMFP